MSQPQPKVRVFNHRVGDAKYAVEFEGTKTLYAMAGDTDEELDKAVKKAGLWKKGQEYPGFTIYKDGKEFGGGGGSNSGTMDRKAPRVRVFNHRTGDLTPADVAEFGKWKRIRDKTNPALDELQSAAGQLPSRLVVRENIAEARSGLNAVIRAANKALSALEG